MLGNKETHNHLVKKKEESEDEEEKYDENGARKKCKKKGRIIQLNQPRQDEQSSDSGLYRALHLHSNTSTTVNLSPRGPDSCGQNANQLSRSVSTDHSLLN